MENSFWGHIIISMLVGPEMEDTPMYGQRDLILTSLNEMHHGFVQIFLENGKCNF